MSDRDGTWLGLPRRAGPLIRAGAVLGVGLGGFVDGIVLHQILQWHHMASAVTDTTTVSGLRLNVLLDGLFHAVAYVATVLGLVLLWRAWRTPNVPVSGRALLGSVVLGWGVFNLVEGVVDHHLLGLHHVWPAGPGPVLLWDVAFLLSGLLFVVVGYTVVRGDDSLTDASGRSRPRTE